MLGLFACYKLSFLRDGLVHRYFGTTQLWLGQTPRQACEARRRLSNRNATGTGELGPDRQGLAPLFDLGEDEAHQCPIFGLWM
jgi:hypothetical protein